MKDKIQSDLTSMWTEKSIEQLGWTKCLVKFFSQSKTVPVIIVALNSSLLITSCAVCMIKGILYKDQNVITVECVVRAVKKLF